MGRHAADRTAPGSPDQERTARAFERLVEPHRAALRAYLLRLTDGNEAVAESVLTETLYRLAQDPGQYPRRPSAVRPWLLLAARDVLRDGERHAPAVRLPVTAIVAMLNDLPAMDRELIVELVYGGVSLRDAAVDRGVPVETIKSRLYSALRTLRAALDQHP